MKKVLFCIITIFVLCVNVCAYDNPCNDTTQFQITGGILKTISDPENINNNVVKIIADGNINICIPITPINGGLIEFSYRLRFRDMGSHIIYLPTLSSDGENIVTPMYHQGGLAIHNGTSMSFIRTYFEDNWYNFKYVIDTETLTFDVYVDNVKICSNFKFSKAIIKNIEEIKCRISNGYILLDNISVNKIGNGGVRTILFNSDYQVDHINHTIGRLPYNMSQAKFLSAIKNKSETTIELTSKKGVLKDGDKLIATDNRNNSKFEYTIGVRTPDISLSFAKQFKNSLIIKMNSNVYYCNGVLELENAFVNSKIKKESLLKYSITTDKDLSLIELNEMGIFVKEYGNDFILIKKDAFPSWQLMTSTWKYDIERLFEGVTP